MPTDDAQAEWQEPAHAGEREECIRAEINLTPDIDRKQVEILEVK